MFHSFEQSCSLREVQTWIGTCLIHLPYEPLELFLDKCLTWKMCFLLALTSTKRVSELHGLSFRVGLSHSWKFCSFSFLPNSVFKIQSPSMPDPRFEEFTIPSLDDFVSGDQNDFLLYPIRTLERYVVCMALALQGPLTRSAGPLGGLMVNLFATRLNYKLPVYVSPLPNSQAWKEDPFRISWDHLEAYAFPPFAVIRSVLNKVMVSDGLSLVLVTPLWPHREWFPDPLSLLVAEPLDLARLWNLLVQPHIWKFYQGLDILNFHA